MTTLSNFQGARSIAVIADDTRPTPNPASLVHGGTTTAVAIGKLTDGGARFTEYNIAVGDIVYNDTTGQITDVRAVDSNSTLAVTDNIFLLGQNYRVFRISQIRPFLFTLNGPDTAPVAGNAQPILIVNAGGDTETYALKVGDSAPVQAVRIPRTGNPAGLSGTATFA